MTINFRYEMYDILGATFMGNLYPRESAWAESVNGGTTWSGKVTVPGEEGDQVYVQTLQQSTALGMALFIKTPEGAYPWSGYISKREWDPDNNELTLTATEWRAYLYRMIAGPQEDYDPNDLIYSAQDQLFIARDILSYYVLAGFAQGVPNFKTSTDLSGVNRDLLMSGTLFRSVGTWIDSMANRDNGFEWDIQAGKNSSGAAILTFQTYYPQRGGLVENLVFRYGQGGNMLSYDSVEESNENMVTRVWAVGSGPDSDSLPYAQDSDPDMMAGASILRLEKATSYQDVVEQATLESYARSERDFYGVPLTLFSFTVSLDFPYAYSYGKGDRCRIVVKDRWLDLDVENVRIIERTISPDSGLSKVTVDLSDLLLPDTDPNGTV